MAEVKIGNTWVGDNHPCYIVAEIGINHNGDIALAKKLIDAAVNAKCNAVKFQKRTIEEVYSAEELSRPRENPFGYTNGDLKYGLELELEDYQEIDRYCRQKNIVWFASCWDRKSVDFIAQFGVPCYKIASPTLTDNDLLCYYRSKGKPVILATGMSVIEQIDHAVEIVGREDLIILHATSTYPASYEELNLRVLHTLKNRYKVPIGYSGHETGIATSVAAAVLGACMIERHITLDRSMWGSDQAASLGAHGFEILVRDIRLVESSMGDGIKRIYEREIPVLKKLRRVQK
jgi:N-acetylneuraminate synthase